MKALWGSRHTTWDGSGGGEVYFPCRSSVLRTSGKHARGKQWHFKPWRSARISRAARDIFRAPFVTGGDFLLRRTTACHWDGGRTAERQRGTFGKEQTTRERPQGWRGGGTVKTRVRIITKRFDCWAWREEEVKSRRENPPCKRSQCKRMNDGEGDRQDGVSKH